MIDEDQHRDHRPQDFDDEIVRGLRRHRMPPVVEAHDRIEQQSQDEDGDQADDDRQLVVEGLQPRLDRSGRSLKAELPGMRFDRPGRCRRSAPVATIASAGPASARAARPVVANLFNPTISASPLIRSSLAVERPAAPARRPTSMPPSGSVPPDPAATPGFPRPPTEPTPSPARPTTGPTRCGKPPHAIPAPGTA